MAGAGGYFAPYIRNYIARSGAPDDIGIQVAVKDRLNALRNPYAHLHDVERHVRWARGGGLVTLVVGMGGVALPVWWG